MADGDVALHGDGKGEVDRCHLRRRRERVEVAHDLRVDEELVVEEVARVAVDPRQTVDQHLCNNINTQV